MSVDWAKIRNDYVNGVGNYAELSEKYGVSNSTLTKRGAAEKWAKAKEKQAQTIRRKTEEKTAEKIADTESECAAIMSRIRLKLTMKIEQAVDKLEEVDPGELRKLVQSYKDMSEVAGTEEEKTGVLNDILAAVKGVADD